jgi:uncharacterized protein (DUF934 family)
MPVFNRTGRIVEDNWKTLPPSSNDQNLLNNGADSYIISGEQWQQYSHILSQRGKNLALKLTIDADLPELQNDIGFFSLIVIEFPHFTDGQGFSLAALLRERYGFRGELRAAGNILLDQLFYLKRCGFDSFELPDTDSQSAINPSAVTRALNSFSESYQQSCDQPLPLFRWRT